VSGAKNAAEPGRVQVVIQPPAAAKPPAATGDGK
jgi:hypothetical protein